MRPAWKHNGQRARRRPNSKHSHHLIEIMGPCHESPGRGGTLKSGHHGNKKGNFQFTSTWPRVTRKAFKNSDDELRENALTLGSRKGWRLPRQGGPPHCRPSTARTRVTPPAAPEARGLGRTPRPCSGSCSRASPPGPALCCRRAPGCPGARAGRARAPSSPGPG